MTKHALILNEILRIMRRGFLPSLFSALQIGSAHGASAANKMLKVTTKDVGGVTHFYVQNLEAAEVTATFDMRMTNLHCSARFPFTTTFPGSQTVEAFTVSPIEPSNTWSFSYNDAFTIGSLTAVHDDSVVYQLPYAPGKEFRVTQGYHGGFSHTGPDEFAIDWKMPIGTPVYAARGGVVVKARGDSDVGGPDRKYEDCANCVYIQHTDGTIGIYAHLKRDGCKVKVGDRVKTGELIALSGNTGFTSGPHLHFSVFKTKSGRARQSIPVRFQTADARAITLIEGHAYKAIANELQMANLRTASNP